MLRETKNKAKKKTIDLKISNGSLVGLTGEHKGIKYESVSGAITGIRLKEHTDKNGEQFKLWHIGIYDTACDESYDISYRYDSRAFRSTLLAIACDEGQEHRDNLEIRIYSNPGCHIAKAAVYTDGERIHWPDTLAPAIRYIPNNGRIIRNIEAELNDLEAIVRFVNQSIRKGVPGRYRECAPSISIEERMRYWNSHHVSQEGYGEEDYEGDCEYRNL